MITLMQTHVQYDFQSQVLSSIQHGVRTKKVEFTEITGYQSEVMSNNMLTYDMPSFETTGFQ